MQKVNIQNERRKGEGWEKGGKMEFII